jgi:hypothetical protein
MNDGDRSTMGDVVGRLSPEAAHEALRAEIQAVPDTHALPINVDVMAAVMVVLGVVPELRALRAEVQELPRFDVARFDKLEQYALALSHTHAVHRSSLPSKISVVDLGTEVTELRDRLYADALSVAGHKLMDAERLQECKKAQGYRAAATDIFTIVALFKEHWAKLESRTPVTRELLDDAASRATELISAIGVREQAPVDTGQAARLRQKAFRLFADAYEDARRAVTYLRWHMGDADDIAPSFYGPRGARRRPAEEAPEQESETPAAAAAAARAREPADDNAPLPMENNLGIPLTNPLSSH